MKAYTNEQLFEADVRNYLDKIANMLILKNKQYGDSALNPIRIFSKANTNEQLLVRLDDKLSRIVRGDVSLENEEVLDDIMGYLTLIGVNKKREAEDAV